MAFAFAYDTTSSQSVKTIAFVRVGKYANTTP